MIPNLILSGQSRDVSIVPTDEQPGTYGEQLAALDLYGSLPWFIVNAMSDDAWQYCRERCSPHAEGAAI